jgi:hypothetical protein
LAEQLEATFGEVVKVGHQRTPDIENGEPFYYASVGE